MAEYIYLVQMDVPDYLEADFNRIYETEHIPNMLGVPGVRGCKRYRLEATNIQGLAKYAAIYEVDSPEVSSTPAFQAAADEGDYKTKIRPYTTNRSRITYKCIS